MKKIHTTMIVGLMAGMVMLAGCTGQQPDLYYRCGTGFVGTDNRRGGEQPLPCHLPRRHRGRCGHIQ